jgi:succinate dehydrogenase / fumarate reductase, cytochrome b subunit
MYPVRKERRAQAYAELWPSRPRWGVSAWWAQRLTGVALTVYVVWHVVTIGRAASRPEMLAGLLRVLTHPVSIALLLIGLAYHTVNGIRVVLVDLGVAALRRRAAFWIALAVAGAAAAAGVGRGSLRLF